MKLSFRVEVDLEVDVRDTSDCKFSDYSGKIDNVKLGNILEDYFIKLIEADGECIVPSDFDNVFTILYEKENGSEETWEINFNSYKINVVEHETETNLTSKVV